MTYAEYLKVNGATEEEVKLLDTAVARKAFDKTQAELDSARSMAAKADKDRLDYEAKVEEWHSKTIMPDFEKMQQAEQRAIAEAARAKAILEDAQKKGLISVADGVLNPPEVKKTPVGDFDPANYYPKSEVDKLAQYASDSIAIIGDVLAEHAELFPGTRPNIRELRDEAQRRKMRIDSVWEEKYKVGDARAAKVKAVTDAHDKAIADRVRTEVTTELTSRFSNPDTRPLTASRSPLTARPDSGRDKQPWEMGDKTGDRVTRATQSVLQKQVQ